MTPQVSEAERFDPEAEGRFLLAVIKWLEKMERIAAERGLTYEQLMAEMDASERRHPRGGRRPVVAGPGEGMA